MANQHLPSTGNRFIDADHARLEALIRKAAELARADGDPDGFRRRVAEFRDLLARHFAVEEVIVGGAGFQSLDEHEERHRHILAEMDRRIGLLEIEPDAPARFDLIESMERVLFDHELVEDSLYWTAIRDSAQAFASGTLPDWAREFDLGIGWLDEQHHRLMATLLDLIRAAADPARIADIILLLDRFEAEVCEHFEDEERRLADMGRPISEHRRAHRALLDSLRDMAAACKARPETLATDYLAYWLLDHIRGVDAREFGAG